MFLSGRDVREQRRGILHGRLQVRPGNERAAERLGSVEPLQEDGEQESRLKEIAAADITRSAEWRSGCRSFPTGCGMGTLTHRGFPNNGEKCVIYRMVLYADGFKQRESLSDARVVGGCYMTPLGLSIERRRSVAAARVLTLVPHGERLNDAMDLVVDDVVSSAVEDVPGTDPYGRRVRIFIHPVAFFRDCPAVSATTDLMGHKAEAFCTLCGIRRRKGSIEPEIRYNTKKYSSRLGYMRFEERMCTIRECNPHHVLLRNLSIRCSSSEATSQLPAVKLSEKLRNSKISAAMERGTEVFQPIFDSSLSAAAVPDHLLTVLTKNVLNFCFEELPSDDKRAEMELQIVACKSQNGVPVKGEMLRWEITGGISGFWVLLCSLLFVLLCAVLISMQAYNRSGNAVFILPQKLQDLVARVYRWPSKRTDGARKDEIFDGELRLHYQEEVTQVANKFIRMAPAVYRSHGEGAKVLYKSNVLRAVELCVNFIPNF